MIESYVICSDSELLIHPDASDNPDIDSSLHDDAHAIPIDNDNQCDKQSDNTTIANTTVRMSDLTAATAAPMSPDSTTLDDVM